MDFPTPSPVTLRDRLDVAQLVAYLRSESRKRPVVLLTVGTGETAPHASPQRIAEAAPGRVDVVVLPTNDLTRAFSDSVGQHSSVFRGACRVYPPGDRWESDPYSVPLRLVRNRVEIADLQKLLIEDLHQALERPDVPTSMTIDASSPVLNPVPVPNEPAPSLISTKQDASALAAYLFSERRKVPVVVVTRASTASAAYADVAELRADLAGLADVFEITSLVASWGFSEAAPPMCQVYGGAARVYPIGTEWVDNPYLSPLRFAYSNRDRELVTRALISDALGMSATKLVFETRAKTALVRGVVLGVAGDRGMVKLDDGSMGVLWPALVEPGLPAARLFVKGMTIRGSIDSKSRRIDVRDMLQQPSAALSGYQADDTILVKVSAVAAHSCVVDMFPGVSVNVDVSDVTDVEQSDLAALMTVGETLRAVVVDRGPAHSGWHLSLIEAGETTEIAPPPSILAGGPPWLEQSAPPQPPTDLPRAEPVDELPPPLAARGDDGELIQAIQHENRQLAEQVRQRDAKVERLQGELRRARTDRRQSEKARTQARREQAAQERFAREGRFFVDDAEQLDFEIRTAWVYATLPSEKVARRLKPYTYGPEFLATCNQIQGVPREKIVEVMVQVLTGRDVELASRELHQLRTGTGGDDPPVTRDGGETCWRVSLQVKTPSARRLHYWMCNDGSIEFSSVRLHDDMSP